MEIQTTTKEKPRIKASDVWVEYCISRTTLWRWRKNKRIKPIGRIGKKELLYNRADIEACLNLPKKELPPINLNDENSGYVYIFKQGEFYKIGKSKNVERRLQAIIGMSPYETILVHQILCRNMHEAEKHLHRCFFDKWIKNEWFALSGGDVTELLKIKEL